MAFEATKIHDETGPVVEALRQVIVNTNQMINQLTAVNNNTENTADNTGSDNSSTGSTTDEAILTDKDGTVIGYLRGLVSYRARAEEVQALQDILMEIKKLNIQLSLITNHEISERDLK